MSPVTVLVAVVHGLGGKLVSTISIGSVGYTGSAGLKVPVRVRIGLPSMKRPLTVAVEVWPVSQVALRVPLIVLIRHGFGGKVVIVGRSRVNVPAPGLPGRHRLHVAVPVALADGGRQTGLTRGAHVHGPVIDHCRTRDG